MIKVKNLNKFYNKNKSNQIHVINDISLEFENTGLVCLLGPSGSGKTTLLNAIGGLDKVESGTIEYNQDILSTYKSDDWDFVRNKHVGYIFQNYNLLLNLSVYDNVMFTLKMTNLSFEEAHERVMYALKSVGIEKYYKRKVTQLSGGQQQRVAIARALAKSPNVIIADEPTGNLDEKNTTMIMNILKQISKSTLVILVTHEQRIADFYANRIIRLKDGQIVSDEVNQNNESYVYSDDNNIYLKDLSNDKIESNNVNINYFYDKEKIDLEFNVILKNNTFYIEPINSKIEIISPKDEMKVINDTKPVIEKEQLEEFTYDLDKIKDLYYKKKSNIKFKDCMQMAFKRVIEMKRLQKMIFIGFLLSAFLFLFSMGSLYSSLNIDDTKFMNSGYNEYSLSIRADNLGEVIKGINENNLGILYEKRTLKLDYDLFEQVDNNLTIDTWSNSFNLKDNIKNSDIIKGDIGGYNSILLDKLVVDYLLENKRFTDLGFDSYDDFIGMTINNEQPGISGIVDKRTPEIYLEEEYFIDYIIKIDQNYFKPSISTLSLNNNEIYINDRSIALNSEVIIFDESYTVIGYCDYGIMFNEADYFKSFNNYLLNKSNNSFNLNFYSYDNTKTYRFLKDNNDLFQSYTNIYQRDYGYYIEEQMYTIIILFGLSIILITTSLVFLYFIMRSSLISRVYDIGVYRSLGITKKDIRKIFASEILLISLVSSFVGWLISYVIIIKFGNLLGLSLPILLSILTLLLIFLLNIVIGLKPVNSLLKLTPSEIGSKYDI